MMVKNMVLSQTRFLRVVIQNVKSRSRNRLLNLAIQAPVIKN
jgi:hypothetical protein